jgi:hypothetical protein
MMKNPCLQEFVPVEGGLASCGVLLNSLNGFQYVLEALGIAAAC